MKKLTLLLLLLAASYACAQGPAKTTIADTVYAPNGALLTATLRITNATFTSADGYAIPAGSITVNVVNGVLNIPLVPTAGANPAGQSYKVDYFLSVRTTEIWTVPNSGTTNLAGVRALAAPLPTVMLAMSQINPPAGCLTGQVPTWNTSTLTWTCTTPGGSGSTPTGNGFRHVTSGVEDGTALAIDVSSAHITGILKATAFPILTGDLTTAGGTLATTLANSGVTAGTYTKITVDSKGRATVGANLIAGDIPAIAESQVSSLVGDLSLKTATSRNILTSAPLSGGGDLSADRTISISDCVASGASHARGTVPDPGASAGTTRFLREDCTWFNPPSGFANPMTTLGDLIIGGASGAGTRLAGDTSNARKFLMSLSSGGVAAAEVWSSLLSSDVGLGSLTNDAQTKAAIVPNTAPSAGQVLAGNAGGTAYAPVGVSGDISLTSAGVAALLNIPAATPAVGTIVRTNIAAPSSPAAGKDATYSDSTDLRFHDKNASGVIGTTVVADAGAANNFLTGVTAAGAITKAQPSFSNLSGSVAAGQMPALTGDVTASAGTTATTLANIPTTATMAGKVTATNIAAPATPSAGTTAVYVDSSTKKLCSKDDAGAVNCTGATGGSAQYITNGNLLGLGDSIVSKNSNGGTYGFTGLMALRDFRGWYLNRGLANDMAADMALKAYDAASSSYVAVPSAGNIDPPTVSIMIGTNDATVKGTGSYQTGVYQRADLAAMAFVGIPRKDTIYMQDAAVTKAGGFAADNTVLTGLGEKVSANAATLTFTIVGNGNPLEVTYLMKDAATGTFCVKIDGTCATDTIGASTTVNSFGPVAISTTNGATTSPALARFAMSAASHTIAITTTNAGENNILSAGVMPLTTSTDYVLAPSIMHWGVLRQQAAANETATSAYDAQASTDCALMAGDGIRCNFVTGSHAAVPDACFADSKHPADCGHEILYALVRSLNYLPGGGGNTFYYLQFPYITSAQPWALATAKIFAAQSATDLYFGTDQIAGTEDVSIHAHNVKAENSVDVYTAGEASLIGQWVGQEFDVANNVSHGWSNSNSNLNTIDTRLTKLRAGVLSFDTGTAGNALGSFVSGGINIANGNRITLTSDWTCGTGGTVSSCVAAQIVGSGGGNAMTFTLPLVAQSWHLLCNGVVGEATAATANSWNILTATNGATNLEANYTMSTAATATAAGALTGQASTTTTVVISPTWTLGATATKMPFRVEASIEGASASGTVVSFQLVAPTVGDLVTIYRGTSCEITASKQ